MIYLDREVTVASLGSKLKQMIKANGFLKVHVWSLRSRNPFKNTINYKRNRLFRSVITKTLVSYERLLNTYDLSRKALEKGVDGCFVECGVWQGGVVALMARVLEEAGCSRYIHLFDSFEGCPSPTEEDAVPELISGQQTGSEDLTPIGLYVASIEEVSAFLFDELKLSRAPRF